MKYIMLAGLVVVLNFVFAIVNEMHIFTTAVNNTLEDKITSNLIVQALTGSQQVTLGSILQADQYFVAAAELFISFFQMTFGIPGVLSSSPFLWPDEITAMITMLMVLIYALGIAEFLRGLSGGD